MTTGPGSKGSLIAMALTVIFLFLFGVLRLFNTHSHRHSEANARADIKQGDAGSIQATAIPEVHHPPLVVSVNQLISDYQENAVNADLKYGGRPLELFGAMVVKVFKDEDGNPVVLLRNYIDFPGVTAILDQSEMDSAAMLRLGNAPHLLCQGAAMIMGRIMVRRCKILPRGYGWPGDGLSKEIADALSTPDLAPKNPGESSVVLDTAGRGELIAVSGDCGSAGCSWQILDKQTRRPLTTPVGLGALHSTRKTKNGYYDLLVENKDVLTLYEYDGTSYKEKSCYTRSDDEQNGVAVAVPC